MNSLLERFNILVVDYPEIQKINIYYWHQSIVHIWINVSSIYTCRFICNFLIDVLAINRSPEGSSENTWTFTQSKNFYTNVVRLFVATKQCLLRTQMWPSQWLCLRMNRLPYNDNWRKIIKVWTPASGIYGDNRMFVSTENCLAASSNGVNLRELAVAFWNLESMNTSYDNLYLWLNCWRDQCEDLR